MSPFYLKWTRRILLNLVLVALAGTLLRYKTIFPLPFIDHKNLLHGHSHFAFSGWVSQAICLAIISMIDPAAQRLKQYDKIIWAAQLSAYGMLLSFPFVGYSFVSILFSTLSVLVSWWFTVLVWKDLAASSLPGHLKNWFRAALFFNVISAFGAFHLGWLMASGTGSQQLYIGSVYFFLHFQYNGWFAFAIIGLLLYKLYKYGIAWKPVKMNLLFHLFFWSCIPAFFLSALWMQLPAWLSSMAAAAAVVQVIAWLLLGTCLLPLLNSNRCPLPVATRWLWALSLSAFSIKIILQLLSVVPQLAFFAFGFRPVVIGYLHLILLGFVTLFLLGYMIQKRYIGQWNRSPLPAIGWFTAGVVLNEVFLFMQAMAAIGGRGIPSANFMLLGASVLMLCSLLVIYATQRTNKMLKYETSSNPGRTSTVIS